MKRNLKRAVWIVLALAVGAVIFWSAASDWSIPVRVVEVRPGDPHASVSTNGRVEPARVQELRATQTGFARKILAREGDRLRAGDPVLELAIPALGSDRAAARAELAAAELDAANTRRGAAPEELNQADAEIARLRLELEGARAALATSQALLDRKAVVAQEVAEGRRAVDRAEQALAAAVRRRGDVAGRIGDPDRRRAATRVEAARARARYLDAVSQQAVVRAPVGGTLYQFDVKEGAFLNAGDPVGLVADLGDLRVRALVDEPELGRVRVGAPVTIHWDARAGATWRGEVERMPVQVVARGNRYVGEVVCSITPAEAGLMPNVNVDVEIGTSSGATVATVPRTAVLQDGSGQYVWTVRDGRAARRGVETGRSNSSIIEIQRGLQVGERVLVLGDAPLTEGTRVRIVSP